MINLEEGVSFYSQLSTAPEEIGENTTAQTLPPTRSRKTIFWKLTMKWWCRWASESACIDRRRCYSCLVGAAIGR